MDFDPCRGTGDKWFSSNKRILLPGWVVANMSKEIQRVVNQVEDLIDPIIEEMGLELVDVEYLSERGRWVLRVYIDHEEGVSVEDCAQVSEEIGELIDVKDIIQHEYVLEVSSPGLDRPLKREKDFRRAVGEKIKVRTVAPINGRRNYTGVLQDFSEERLYLDVEDGGQRRMAVISLPDVEKANLVYEL